MLIYILTLSVCLNQIRAIKISNELTQRNERSLVGYLNGHVHGHGHGHHANHVEVQS